METVSFPCENRFRIRLLGGTVVVVVVGIAIAIGDMKHQESHGGRTPGHQKHRVEPSLVETEPVGVVRRVHR